MKKTIALLLILTMYVGLFPANVQAEEDVLILTDKEVCCEEEVNASYDFEMPVLGAVSTSYSPNPMIEYGYSSSVSVGTIRYISQVRSGSRYNASYWPESSFGGYGSPESECGTSSLSMALSYIGVNKTPKDILEANNGYTVFGNWGAAIHSAPSFSIGMDNYINGGGKYSPVVIHLQKYSGSGHYVVVVGKESDSTYYILDPWECSVASMTISGSSATYTKSGKTINDTIDKVYQWYNESAINTGDPNTLPTIAGANCPETFTVGKAFSIKGTIYSGSELSNVTVGCYDANGTMKVGKGTDPSGTTYDLKNIDNDISFGKLTPGVYYYRVTATNAKGTEILVDQPFIVLAKTATIADGTYQIQPVSSKDFAVGIKGDSTATGANVELVKAANKAAQTFQVEYESNGYYSIQNCNSGKYLEVVNGGDSGTNVDQAASKSGTNQRWQILPTGTGYCLVPECANMTCLEVLNGTLSEGNNVLISTVSLEDEQIFNLVSNSGQFEESKFVDISESDYYYDAVLWAVENGITAGTDDTHFSPTKACTRAQVVTFLWRSQGCPEPKTTTNPFVDVPSGKYYTKAVLWALENGITSGKDATHFQPDVTVTRNQFVTFLWRLEGKPAPTIKNPFADVPNGTYYTNAVLWAYEKGITSGKDATHFQPEASCQRCQVVAFLYRAYK